MKRNAQQNELFSVVASGYQSQPKASAVTQAPLQYRIFSQERQGGRWAEEGVRESRPAVATVLRECRRASRLAGITKRFQVLTEPK